MQAQQVSLDDFDFSEALETIELELALQSQDVTELGFDATLDAAVKGLGGQILFQLPAMVRADASEIAAVSLPTGEDHSRKLLLVMLDTDGQTLRVAETASHDDPVSTLAKSMAAVLDTFEATMVREEKPILL